jgi:hypothetical protein
MYNEYGKWKSEKRKSIKIANKARLSDPLLMDKDEKTKFNSSLNLQNIITS